MQLLSGRTVRHFGFAGGLVALKYNPEVHGTFVMFDLYSLHRDSSAPGNLNANHKGLAT